MTQGERTVNGVVLHEVLAYRWKEYLISTDSRATYVSGVGEWTVAHTDYDNGRMTYVDRWWNLADALQGARAHSARLAEEEL